MLLIPSFDNQFIYFAPKITLVDIEKLSLSAGLLYVNALSARSTGVGIFYGVGTYGTDKTAITAGLGWGFHGADVADKPVVMIGGEIRVSKSAKFITGNWFLPNSEVHLLSLGIRFYGENLAADFGFIHPLGTKIKGFLFIPWLGFTYNFKMGKKI